MTVDGFRPGDGDAFGAFDPDLAEHFYSFVARISRRQELTPAWITIR